MRTHTHMRTRTHRDNNTKTKKYIQIEAINTAQYSYSKHKDEQGFFFFPHFDSPALQVIRLGIFGSETTPDVSQKDDGEGAPDTHAEGLTSKSILDINGGGGGW